MLLLALICGTLWLVWWVYAAFAYRPRRLAGATVVVTGACSEVGRRLCLQLYARGARVIAWDYSRIKLLELQTEVQRLTAAPDNTKSSSAVEEHFRIAVVEASSRAQVQRAAKEIDGAVDIIINAAHSYPTRSLRDRADDSIERVFQTNLISPLLVVRQLLPRLFSTGASGSEALRRRDDYAQVVNVVCASAGHTVAARAPDYAASQWGMVGLHMSLRSWIAQERAAFLQSERERHAESRSGGRVSTREVRTTLLCLQDIQIGVPTTLHATLAPASTMLGEVARATTCSPTTLPRPVLPDSVEDTSAGAGGRGVRAARTASPQRESYTAEVQRRSAELDRAVAFCITAISKGQERYCHSARWGTEVFAPLATMCPLPWAERLLRWLQRASAPAASLEG